MQELLKNMDTLDIAYIVVTLLSTILWIAKIMKKYEMGQ